MGVEPTPAMKQYLEVKQNHQDCLVLFRMGDFYELFYEDAAIASRELNITLTTRNKNKEDAVALAGFPYHAGPGYIAKLIARGYKVAVCEQMEDPRLAKGVVKREVVRIITPGLPAGADNLMGSANVFLAALFFHPGEVKSWGAAFLDLSTGEFYLTAAADLPGLWDQLAGVEFREVLLPTSGPGTEEIIGSLPTGENLTVTRLDPEHFSLPRGRELIGRFFPGEETGKLALDRHQAALGAAGAALAYAIETQKTSIKHVKRLRWHAGEAFLILDDTAKRNLELFQPLLGQGPEGTLLNLLDATATPMGKRLLRRLLNHPLRDVGRIEERLDAVGALREKPLLRVKLKEALKEIYDLERLASRIAMKTANGRDLAALRASLQALPGLIILLEEMEVSLIRQTAAALDPMPDLLEHLVRGLVDNPPLSVREGGIIRPGYEARLDELLTLVADGLAGIAALEARERERTGIASLKVGFNSVFGYYIEIGKANRQSLPDDYVRRQTLVNHERYISSALKDYEDRVLSARGESRELEYELFHVLLGQAEGRLERLQATAEALATLDVLLSLATAAADYDYCRPQLDYGLKIAIRDGRHPTVERMPLPGGFVPNDLAIDGEGERFLVITGPNMAGKSTYIRQVALIVIMAQMGSFVPAAAAHIGIVDRIFTRLGAADNLSRGQSTFMVEMTEVASILKNATSRSLVILDEVGRGTGTFDGIAIAWAVAEYLHDARHLKSRTLFATHYHQLVELALTKKGVRNYHIAVRESRGNIVFLRRILPGGTNRSYGIHVARLAGLPEEALGRAREILENMEKRELDEAGQPALARRRKSRPKDQFTLFFEDPEEEGKDFSPQ